VHWVCAVINLKDKQFEYYDSLHGSPGSCFHILRNYLIQEAKDKKQIELDLSEWKDVAPMVMLILFRIFFFKKKLL
jgi:sentrin-specific protease 1